MEPLNIPSYILYHAATGFAVAAGFHLVVVSVAVAKKFLGDALRGK